VFILAFFFSIYKRKFILFIRCAVAYAAQRQLTPYNSDVVGAFSKEKGQLWQTRQNGCAVCIFPNLFLTIFHMHTAKNQVMQFP
jgi:hypothetical protein